MMPRHINPNIPASAATAPYNFVPLPNKIFSVENGIEVDGKNIQPWQMHDKFISGTLNGWIDLEITTLTPLFIRGPITQNNGKWDERDNRLRSEPFLNKQGVPEIPGSSLRGMIRNLVEVLTFSKITPVTNEKPFFRTVARDRIGIAYKNRILHRNKKPIGGYVRKNGTQWVVVPTKEVLRVHREELNALGLNVPNNPNPRYFPDWSGQHRLCWFKRDSHKPWKVSLISLEQKFEGNWEVGTLVLTGSAPNKKYDFIFVGEEIMKSVAISENMWKRFHDKDQLTQWQETAFLKDKPSKNSRKAKGYLRDGEPVFFLTNDNAKTIDNPDGLMFFGRAQMFRYPYDLSPRDLMPEEFRNSGLDIVEVLFGIVRQDTDQKNRAIKGRVFFEDAVATKGGPIWLENIMVPYILSSPNVTCFQHYLTQDGTRSKETLTTYLSGDHTTIRGTKHYWHRWDDAHGLDAVKESNKYESLLNDLQSTNPKETQHTIICPVKDNVIFSGRVRFENLTDIEIGALLAALILPEGCAHKLGMGKPLGLGSIRIVPKLYLVDRGTRYTSWENLGANVCDGNNFLNAFEKEIIAHAQSSQEAMDGSKHGLQKIGRLQALYHLLMWEGKPQFSNTAYLPLNRFGDRLVLPTPHKVIGEPEPCWQEDRPRPGQQEADSTSMVLHNSLNVQVPIPPPRQTTKLIAMGQTRNGTLSHRGERWIAMFEGDSREAVIVNEGKIPPDTAELSYAEFYITMQNKKNGIKARFERLI